MKKSIDHETTTNFHAPSDLREQFLEWLDSYEPNRLQEIDILPVSALLDTLADCGDVLPTDYCDQLEISKGSTYAQAVADIRQWSVTKANGAMSAIRAAAKDVLNQVYDCDCTGEKLDHLRDTLAEARRQGLSESQIEDALEEVRQSHPEVAETWPEILTQITVYVWLEDPDGNWVRGNTVIIDRLIWQNDDEDLLLENTIQDLRDDLEAQWEVVEPSGTASEQQASPLSLPVTPDVTSMAAKAAAEFFRHCLMHEHRGVWGFHDKVIVFGNDGYRIDSRTQREVELVREHLEELDLPSGEFGTSSDGYSWALVIPNYGGLPVDVGGLREKVQEIWGKVCEAG